MKRVSRQNKYFTLLILTVYYISIITKSKQRALTVAIGVLFYLKGLLEFTPFN